MNIISPTGRYDRVKQKEIIDKKKHKTHEIEKIKERNENGAINPNDKILGRWSSSVERVHTLAFKNFSHKKRKSIDGQ